MRLERTSHEAHGVRFSIREEEGEIARAWLYLMQNDLHDESFGLLEDVHVDESRRGQGLGTELVEAVIAAAKEAGCYKLIATSRHARSRVHELYERLGFANHGIEFRIDF
jgi:GNAT superfamily N-acetyltransferase